MKEKTKVTIIIVLVVALSASFFVNYVDPRNQQIHGTYISGDQMSPDAVYLVFEQESPVYGGNFAKYRQFEMMEYGSFAPLEGNIYSLYGASSTWKVIFVDNAVYLIYQTGEVSAFARLSRMPTYINVFPPDFSATVFDAYVEEAEFLDNKQ
ncbi:MAG: hypothetical protein FWE32_09775 [Oscillospiraceae bacterium]|nr:hypothetical protein [Oscillospiraceae bacterium]